MVGKFTSTGRKLISGSILQVGNLVATALSSFFLMPFIVHHLGDRIYGFWTLAFTFIGYYFLLDFGLSGAVSQFMSIALGRNDHAECKAVFNTSLRIQSFLGGIALLATVLIVIATPWLCHSPSDVPLFREVIAILGVSTALGFPVRVYGGVLYTQLRYDIQSWLSLLGLVLRTGLVFWAILAGGSLLSLAWMTLLATLPVYVLQIWYARREASWARLETGSAELKVAKSLSSYSVYTFLAGLADTLRFQIDPLVISGFIGLAAVTHYRVAGIFAQYYLQILIFSVGMLQPVFSRLHGAGDRAGLEKTFFFGTKLAACFSVFMCVALIGWGKPFIARWMGASYEDAYWPLVTLSLAVFLDVSQKPSIDLLYATFNHRFYTYTNWAEGLLNLGFSLALARPLGILGVALGTLIGALIIRLAVQPWWVCKVSALQYGMYMKFVGKHVLYSVCLAAVAVGIASWGLRPSYILLIASAICATAVYALGSWLLLFDRREKDLFRAAITTRDKKAVDLVPAAEPALSQTS